PKSHLVKNSCVGLICLRELTFIEVYYQLSSVG
ncbi:MAG: hypothetical protein ACJA13_000592, partial [Paraglaciecola sp.]